ncbi:tyrosine-protein phosphatase [Halioglobus maricola]|uniref:Tyrosine-protein phosphatase n=1 Tax=Halioglobus maricola TaxID=2601894 RepID=A0A5P9NH65_9GAMM|nr:tyrosine-protein phosphatase [Halioglobus maricola]QFU75163.1 tyrosine-protein phosphatase [Halioglobus maricola]
MFDLSHCSVERDDAQNYWLRWDGPHPEQEVSVYMTDDAEAFYNNPPDGEPLLRTRAREARLANPHKDLRHYFYLLSEHGEGLVLAERRLALAGTPNFRDLGGYEASDGARLKWGKLFRSSKLSQLTEEDRGRVRGLGLTLVCDFRQAVEQELDPTHIGEDASHLHASLPVAPGSARNFLDNLHNGIIAVDNASEFMRDMNRDFVASQLPQYAEMFRLLLQGDHATLIHCASGKDRTGFGSALILDVLGVPEDTIVEDYLLTNEYLSVEQELGRLATGVTDEAGEPLAEEVLRPLIEVRPEYIKACFEEIARRYESKEHFYEAELKLDPESVGALKDRYLQ